MATIRERHWTTPSGEPRSKWICDFFDAQGTRRQKTFRRKKDADQWLVQARAQVAAGTYTPESTSATVGEAVDLWVERAAAEGLEHGTQQQYRQHRDHLIKVIDRNTKLARLSTARCEQLRDDLLRVHSREMARKILVSFKSAIRDARRRGLIASNPAADTTIGANGRHKERLQVGRDIPTPTEVKTMLEAASPKAKAMIALAALAGLRASEIRALPWSAVELGASPTVTVSTRADKWSRIGSPKSKASRRTIPLGDTTVRALKEWRLAQPIGRTLAFGTATDKPDLLGNLTKRVLAPLTGYGWHSLRHYAISSWLASGVDLKTAQHWAGHATSALTLDTYGHMIPRTDDHDRIAAAESALFR